ncbi:hypothetical protein MLD38_011922 [Melastoma candidum]|uniref:Uncharacterized protein n=1 Tax=Melastoma candidum TaxID=119954 RepID=A0ACB9R4P8_9MYRT|nr:hypothetical protein MLD38_011922 [Melastoma candidum]
MSSKTPNPSGAADADPANPVPNDADEEAERGFSLFMKSGGCADPFLSLGKCFSESARIKEDPLDRCLKAASDLKNCVSYNLDYFRPVFSVSVSPGETEEAAAAVPNPTAATGTEVHASESPKQEEEGGEDGEEEGECGFCLFMKGGGCKDAFVDWEKCIEEAEKSGEDIVDKCFQATSALKTCMEAHSDYYEPILRAEKAAEEEAVRQLEEEASELKKSDKDAAAEEGK